MILVFVFHVKFIFLLVGSWLLYFVGIRFSTCCFGRRDIKLKNLNV